MNRSVPRITIKIETEMNERSIERGEGKKRRKEDRQEGKKRGREEKGRRKE